LKYGWVGCIGFNPYGFGDRSPTVARCIDFNDNLSLAAGRDLSRVSDSGAPSPGFDALDVQRSGSFVLNDKTMGYFSAVCNLVKGVTAFRYYGGW